LASLLSTYLNCYLVVELDKYSRRFLGGFPLLLGLGQRIGHQRFQSLVPRQAQYVIDAVLLTPSHELVHTESRVATQDDLHIRPAQTDPFHDACYFLLTAHRRSDAAGP